MFNGYNETPLISYELNQERTNKKQDNAPKWPYGHDPAVQPPQTHPANRQPEFWTGKPGFMGLSNVVKCSCAGCYPSSENQSYQGDTTRHRPWLPRTFPVPLNGSNEPCKLPPYQWDNGSHNQGSCYPETNVSFVQENGGKHPLYRHYQESNQPGVITSLKNVDFAKKQKEEATLQNGRQPVFCNPIYNLTKRSDGRNYCDPNEKYSNAASFSVDQHLGRLSVVEPYIKPVPSNLSQNRVPSTGYRSVKENVCQPYPEPGYGDPRKMCGDTELGAEKRSETFLTGALATGAHVDYSHFGRDLSEAEQQKLFFDSARHSDYYSRKNFQDVINRNNQTLDNRKDCAINQINLPEQYNLARGKYQAPGKPSCDSFHPKDFDKTRPENHLPENSPCFQRNENKDENMNVHARLTRSALIFNDPRFAERTQNPFPYQTNPAYRNYARPEYSYQGYNAQHRYDYPPEFQRNEFNQYKVNPQSTQPCDQFIPQQGNGFLFDTQNQQNSEKTAQFYTDKNLPSVILDSLPSDSKKPTYLEPVRSEGVNRNGPSKISPLRLLRKKKFINVPHEPVPASSLDSAPGLDVRKFWSTWAEEEEENVAPTQMVVLDCQNIDPEQAKLLHLYETDPVRAVQLENGGIVIKGSACDRASAEVPSEDNTTSEVSVLDFRNDPPTSTESKKEENTVENDSTPSVEPTKSAVADSTPEVASPPKIKSAKAPGMESRGEKKCEVMDKWTEKKFDFLKRSEESKAAEILRHEEEKKKIFETRLSLQQSLKKLEKPQVYKQGEKMSESMSPFDENSQSSSPDNRSGDGSNLPTSEYRRNKFLDYSDKKVTMNGAEESDVNEKLVEPVDADGIKKENVKLERGHSSEKLFPLLDGKVKEEPSFEIDDILHKISEINFQNRETKLGNGTEDVIAKKMRNHSKKVKKKKSDHQPETDQRSDKLTLETVKFSIQKSHDLKISLKVLNNSKKCSDEETGNKDTEVKGSPVEDSKNSTELITLSYKSIQRDGDRRQPSEPKKSRRRFRQKNEVPDEKTPVLKIKKSRYMPHTERDPLGNYEDEVPKKPYSEGYPLSDDFHVHETVDSAKIKLTFKRHKTNFETEYKINSNSVADLSELEPVCEDHIEKDIDDVEKVVKNSSRKKSNKTKENDIFAEAGVESFQDNEDGETPCDLDSDQESISRDPGFVSNLEDNAENSATSRDSFTEEENIELPSTRVEPDVRLSPTTFQNEELPLEGENDNSTPSEENADKINDTDYSDRKEMELDEANEGNDFSVLRGNDENWKESTSGGEEIREKGGESEREEISEISLDFIRSTNSKEIETNREPGKTEEREKNNVESSEENDDSSTEINHSELLESSCESKSEGEDSQEDLWKEASAGEIQGDGFGSGTNPEKASDSPLPLFSCENDAIKNCISCDDRGNVIYEDDLNEVSSDVEKPVEPEPVEESPPEESNDNANSSQAEPEESARFEVPSSGDDTVEDLLESETVEMDEPTANEGSNPQSDCEKHESSIPEMVENSESELNSQNEQNCDEARPDDCGRFEISRSSPSGELVCTNSEALSPTRSTNIDAVDVTENSHDEGDISLSENNTEASVVLKPEIDETTENIEETVPEEPPAETSETPAPSQCTSTLVNTVSNEAESSGYPAEETTEKDLPSSDTELEEGEIVDSSDDENPPEKEESPDKLDDKKKLRKHIEFVCRKIERRNSVGVGESQWCKRKFSKAESCPPAMRFTEEQKSTKIASPEDVKIEEIPLPLGPPPRNSCFDFKKFMNSTRENSSHAEAKEKPKESIDPEQLQVIRKELDSESPSGMTDPQKDQNPVCVAETAPPLGIFQRSSKIKFSISKRSRFSKIGLNSTKEPKPDVLPPPKVEKESEKKDRDCGCEVNKESTTTIPAADDQNPVPAECQSEQVPNENVANETERPITIDEPDKPEPEPPEELLTEDLRENIEEIRAMSDYMRDEFYECEDIPTSEDLTNGEDPENEKVNDDKFRNIMQNCLDNAKKFLNVGNLKLFSCSVDDLLELDCQAPDSTVDEPQANHISRDVLLTSCEDTNDELALEENVQPPDFSMDFVPSFCSDVCPEILPVDNWPYLEEEVPSSPTKPSQDETDLIPSLEIAHSNNTLSSADNHHQFHSKNGIDRQKRVITENCFKRFRRRSLISESESTRICSKIGTQRRNTVDSLSGVTCGREIRDIQSELLRWKAGKDEEEKQSLKCRLSLEKLHSKHGVNFKFKSARMKRMSEESEKRENGKSFDYKSPTWQPKVMLLRISKHELRKLRRDSKHQKRSDPGKREISSELENQHVPVKKTKTESGVEEVYLKLERDNKEAYTPHENEERLVGLPGLESIKGSLSVMSPTDERKRKKRFRNLHKKRKSDLELEKDVEGPAQKFPSTAPGPVDAETALTELFKDCDRVPSPQIKDTKDFKMIEKPKKKSSESTSSVEQPDISKREEKGADSMRHSYSHEACKHRDKIKKSHRERRKERGEEYSKHKDRHRDSEKGLSRHGSSHHQHDRSRHFDGELDGSKGRNRDRSRSNSGGEPKGQKGESNWCCEVCGFNDAEERISHIKSHPFHCQSCHLAFKTEAYFVSHLTKKHKDIRNQHHCLLCELSFDTEEQYQGHMETREHRHLESVEKNTINTLFTILTGAPCPVLGLVEMKPEWLPNQAGTVHFYHQATPLSLALQTCSWILGSNGVCSSRGNSTGAMHQSSVISQLPGTADSRFSQRFPYSHSDHYL